MNRELISGKTAEIEDGFAPYMPEEAGYQKTVFEAMNYSVTAGGKRIRPMLMREMYRLLGGEDEKAVRPFMMAVEMIHTYSLVHDDLPAMDNDDYRRGQLTTHKKYGEAMGILAGDALLNGAFETAFLAFESGTDAERIGRALRILGEKAGARGMVGGQVVDVENNGCFLDEDTLFFVYKTKTAALLEASLMIGAVLAGADESVIRTAERIGESVGIAFQIQDDILDVVGDEEVIGKPVHSDERNGKSTYTALHGVDKSREKVREYTNKAIEQLEKIPVSDESAGSFLRELIEYMAGRER